MVCLVKPSHRCFGHRHFSGWKTSSSKEFSNDEIGQRLARVLLAVARDNHHLLHHGRLYCRGQRWGSPLQGQGSLCTLLNHQQQQVFVASDLQVRYQNNFYGSRSMKYWMYVKIENRFSSQNFFQKLNHRICFSILISSQDRKTNSLVCFLEEVLAGKFAFEIYWPLAGLVSQ